MATAIMKQKEVPEMDDVEKVISKISEESSYKRRPTQKRTWMTVPERYESILSALKNGTPIRLNIIKLPEKNQVQIPLHRITDSASNGSVFPVVTEHFSASSDHAFL